MKRSNSFCLMRVVLIVQSAEDILRAKSVIYYHYLLLSPPVDGMHAVYIYLYFIFEYTYAVYHPSLMITEYAAETSGHDIT